MKMAYAVSYTLRSAEADKSLAEVATIEPTVVRVKASNATRAISAVINQLKNDEIIKGKGDVIVKEAKVVA